MGNDPGSLSRVQAPWDPAQAVRQPDFKLVESSTPPSRVDVFEQVFGIKLKDGDMTLAKVGSGLLSSVLSLPPIVVDEVLQRVWDKLKDVFGPIGPPPDLRRMLESLGRSLDFDDILHRFTPQTPSVTLGGSSEATGSMTGTSVAHETVPPPAPAAARERNKCSSPSRGTK